MTGHRLTVNNPARMKITAVNDKDCNSNIQLVTLKGLEIRYDDIIMRNRAPRRDSDCLTVFICGILVFEVIFFDLNK